MRRIFIATGVICLFLVSIMIQTSAAQDVISGCYNQRDGKLRIVSDSSKCKKKENFIQWNMQGPQGEPGVDGVDGSSCWDSNGNQTCDIEIEDKNLDGACDSLDCKGGLHVYDADDQYLGILLSNIGYRSSYRGGTEIFIPSLRLAIEIQAEDGSGHIARQNNVFFENPNCSGPAFLKEAWPDVLYRFGGTPEYPEYPARYFVLRTSIGEPFPYRSELGQLCNTGSSDPPPFETGGPAIEILEADIPFNLPVALPLRYE